MRIRSHRDKIAVKRALARLHSIDQQWDVDDPMTDHYGAQEFVSQALHDAERRVLRKVGCHNRDQLERAAARARIQ